MINIRSILTAITLVLSLSGCASPPQLSPQVAASLTPLRDAKIAVSYNLVNKELTSSETLFRLVYLTTNSAKQDFSGIWSADEDLSGHFVDSLRTRSLKAENIYGLIPPTLVTSANAALSKAINENAIITKPDDNTGLPPGNKILPPVTFFEKWPSEPSFSELSDSLQSKGIRYLLQLTAMNINAVAAGYGMVGVNASVNARILDLQQHQVLWSHHLFQGDIFQLGGDLKALEINSMAKTKEGMANGAKKIDFSALWQLK